MISPEDITKLSKMADEAGKMMSKLDEMSKSMINNTSSMGNKGLSTELTHLVDKAKRGEINAESVMAEAKKISDKYGSENNE